MRGFADIALILSSLILIACNIFDGKTATTIKDDTHKEKEMKNLVYEALNEDFNKFIVDPLGGSLKPICSDTGSQLKLKMLERMHVHFLCERMFVEIL